MLFALYTDWLYRKALLAALGVEEDDMLGVGEQDSVLDNTVEPAAPSGSDERRRQVEAFIAAAGGG
jgi:hypothetical protein